MWPTQLHHPYPHIVLASTALQIAFTARHGRGYEMVFFASTSRAGTARAEAVVDELLRLRDMGAEIGGRGRISEKWEHVLIDITDKTTMRLAADDTKKSPWCTHFPASAMVKLVVRLEYPIVGIENSVDGISDTIVELNKPASGD